MGRRADPLTLLARSGGAELAAVPWCSECARFLSPSTVRPDGACPACGRPVDSEGGRGRALRRIPWHLKLLLAVFVLYLGYRIVQGIEWLIGAL